MSHSRGKLLGKFLFGSNELDSFASFVPCAVQGVKRVNRTGGKVLTFFEKAAGCAYEYT
jgi:hypothetical protein